MRGSQGQQRQPQDGETMTTTLAGHHANMGFPLLLLEQAESFFGPFCLPGDPIELHFSLSDVRLDAIDRAAVGAGGDDGDDGGDGDAVSTDASAVDCDVRNGKRRPVSERRLISLLPRDARMIQRAQKKLQAFSSASEGDGDIVFVVKKVGLVVDPAVGKVEVSLPLNEYTIAEECWNFVPSLDDINKGNLRFIFCNVPLPERDVELLAELDVFMRAEPRWPEVVRIEAEEWLSKYYIRALYSTGFDIPATASIIWLFFDFRMSPELPVSDSETNMMHDLKAGACYFHGRDMAMRPIMFLRLDNIDALDRSTARVLRTITFCAEYFLRYLTIAGKFENWVIVFDCGGRGLMKTNPSLVTTVMGTMHNRYKGRVYRIYITNFPRVFGWLTNWVMGVVPANSAHKLKFCAADWAKHLREIAAPNQLEEKYGGTRPTLKEGEFYPFHFFPGPFAPESKPEECCASSKRNCHEDLDNALLTGASPWGSPATTTTRPSQETAETKETEKSGKETETET